MSRRQSRAFKSQTGKQNVRLDNVVQGRCDDMLCSGHFRRTTVRKQRIITEFGQMQPRQCAQSAALIGRLGAAAGPGFKPGGQRVAHAGYQKARRRFGNHSGIHQHDLRIHFLIKDGFEGPLLRIKNGAAAAGRVGRGDGGNNHHRKARAVGGDFGGVDSLAPAHADQNIHPLAAKDVRQPAQFLFAAFSGKRLDENPAGF
ncbi:MAG: hypothetical protein BWX45_01161 [Deltaproteobacteria bacterium ADurb.Bin002]|nr:MAG: hypothetical protein BWX45_01161 [Deltaproteobacteria bacterium ADurb.Bin002]